ncbi:MAG: DUF938 domain-containing protein, partial [Dokdonella sp.]
MTLDKPWSEACERNRDPILEVLRRFFADRHAVLEIGSGTGQHAVHFAAQLPHLHWQTSDRLDNHPGIRAWLDEAKLPNLRAPLDLDVNGSWPTQRYDAVFSANTLHIMAWSDVQAMFAALPAVMADDFKLAIYGPFNDDGQFSSDSNAAFDQQLKASDPQRGLRDWQAVDRLAQSIGLELIEDIA